MEEGRRVPLSDIHEVAYIIMNGVTVTEALEAGRVLWCAPRTEAVIKLLREYHGNPPVPVLDFVRALRRTRRKMLDLRDGAALTADGGRTYLDVYPDR